MDFWQLESGVSNQIAEPKKATNKALEQKLLHVGWDSHWALSRDRRICWANAGVTVYCVLHF